MSRCFRCVSEPVGRRGWDYLYRRRILGCWCCYPCCCPFPYTRIGITTKVVLSSAGSFTSTGLAESLKKKHMSSLLT